MPIDHTQRSARILDFEQAKHEASRSRARHAQVSERDARRGAHAEFRPERGTARPLDNMSEDAREAARERLRAREARAAAVGREAEPRHGAREAADGDRRPARDSRATAFEDERDRRRKDAVKRRADRLYDRTVRDDAPAPEGPRAALYRGKMGASHKRSARLQNEAAGSATGARAKLDAHKARTGHSAFFTPLVIAACTVMCAAFLYVPAQSYYLALREQAKTQAAYDIASQRNADLQNQVDYLSTDEGKEDSVRDQYGWVRGDENAVNVQGLDDTDDGTSTMSSATINASAPDTWYSGILDPLFGFEG